MTPRQLESRIRALRGSLRRLLALHGFSWVLGLVVPLVILAGFLDWAVSARFRDPGRPSGLACWDGAFTWAIGGCSGLCSSDSPILISPCGSKSGGRA